MSLFEAIKEHFITPSQIFHPLFLVTVSMLKNKHNFNVLPLFNIFVLEMTLHKKMGIGMRNFILYFKKGENWNYVLKPVDT